MRRVLFSIVIFLLAGCASSQDLELSGPARQGALVPGKTVPGAKVFLEDKDVPVGPGGRFVVAFPRDSAEEAHLSARMPDGKTKKISLSVVPRSWKEEHIEGLKKKKVSPDPEALKHIRRDSAAIGRARQVISSQPGFEEGFVWPVKGRISGIFGSRRILNGKPRSPHSGLDIAAPTGTPVKATASGRVSLVAPAMFFTGKTVMIDHGLGVASVYAHLSEIDVEKGEDVRQGAVIGKVGRSGRATGPHLHFGLSWRNVRVDPQPLLGGGAFWP